MTSRTFSNACIAGLLLLLPSCGKKNADANAPAVTDVHVMRAHEQSVDLTGYVPGRAAAYRQAEIRPQVSGVLEKRLFVEGTDVKTGQQLYQIYPVPYEAALAQAKADLAHGEAERVAADARKARFTHLSGINAVSHQDYDDAVSSAAQAAADIASAKAEIMSAQVNLDYSRVYSPISGRISRTLVTEGALVTANQTTPLATVTQLDPIYVDLTVTGEAVSRLRESLMNEKRDHTSTGAGQVDVVLDTGRPYTSPGRIDLLEVMVDPGTGMTTLRTTFQNPDAMLLPGMFVHATLHYGRRKAFLVPQNVVLRDLHADPYVLIAGSDGKAVLRKVKIIQDSGNSWVITDGVSDGDRIITEKLQTLQPGDSIHLLNEPA
ncbi:MULTISPECIES: efflux RND transporter periplasmic adaptor subunit [Acetobacter]|nr:MULTISPECIES: efflux RND transporter periplasmic adaptor subunit [Acetobacter]ATJ91862.1 efflux RND transporter periplasmic adaptor subunit [Acetobacter tropicalis]MCE0742358.1 efflux RND transporter periplasmic adaptor subunit [Acetobacter sicerae]MCG0999230.1 efflux RND transporter periplasmic adaptor subunit [Acetobacter persici]ASL40325.1 efflux RND transporter periplasmic adaptor subunit [Acetobacter oryzifermentans]ATI13292.1 efflux RND transporter periplasmic adaptor subunit [Acetoba